MHFSFMAERCSVQGSVRAWGLGAGISKSPGRSSEFTVWGVIRFGVRDSL